MDRRIRTGRSCGSCSGVFRWADYLSPALAGVGITGAASELADALGVPAMGKGGGVAVPWRILEERAFTTTSANDGPEGQRPILQRLFGPGVMDQLGVRMDSVPVGRTEWPLITGGVSPDQAKELGRRRRRGSRKLHLRQPEAQADHRTI